MEKSAIIKKIIKPKGAPASEKQERYFEAVGRRKTAVARIRLYTKKNGIIINDKDSVQYFPLLSQQKILFAPLEKMKIGDKLGVVVKVKGGGLTAQVEAIRHGLTRALMKFNPDYKKRLKRAGYLTRDARAVERKKYGKHKARRGHQWRKR